MKRTLITLSLALIAAISLMLVSCGGEKTYPVEFVISDVTAKAGETVSVEIHVSSTADINAIALHELTFDEDVLEFVEYANLGDAGSKSYFGEAGLDQKLRNVFIALSQPEKLTGKVCEIRFKVKDGAKAGTVSVSMQPVVKNTSTPVDAVVRSGSVTVSE